MFTNSSNPHENAPIALDGATFDKANKAILLIHGRGATAQSMFALGREFADEQTVLVAPQANGNTWYPYSFMAEETMNQPYLDSALELLNSTIEKIEEQGIPADKIAIVGFSQGACLSLEFVARSPKSFKAVCGLSGGLIGEALKLDRYQSDLKTPVFLGCSDVDFHIPVERVHETADVFESRGATVDKRIYPNMGHHVNDDEVQAVMQLLK